MYFSYRVEALISGGHHECKDLRPLIIVVRFVESEILKTIRFLFLFLYSSPPNISTIKYI